MRFDIGLFGFMPPFQFESFPPRATTLIFLWSIRVLNEAVIDHSPSTYMFVLDLAATDSTSPSSPHLRAPLPTLPLSQVRLQYWCPSSILPLYNKTNITDVWLIPVLHLGTASAAGESVVYHSVPAILITLICAHSLSFRPLVLPNAAV